MLALYTGLPGAGKTLQAIKTVLEDKNYQNRPVYYYGINGCEVSGWSELSLEDLQTWYELDDSPVILIDEVQKVWRQRMASKAIPRAVQELETHRHLGVDFVMTCQYPSQLDKAVRQQIQLHRHFERPANLKQGRCKEFERCQLDPSRPDDSPLQTTRYKLDPKIFNLYKSAEVHTHGARIPKKLYLFAIVAVAFLVFAFAAFERVTTPYQAEETPELTPDVRSSGTQLAAPDPVESGVTYLSRHAPRVEFLPYSSPFYDSTVEPVSYPKVSGCLEFVVNGSMHCECTTQQGTLLNLPEQICAQFVVAGSFDFSQEDTQDDYERYLPTGEPCCGSGVVSVGQEGSEDSAAKF